MAFLAVPQPFDFELTTERFRGFGPDLANLWHEGGLHRVVGGREVRVEAAPGGVDVEPLDEETGRVLLKLLGAEFDLAGFESRPGARAGGDPAPRVSAGARLRPVRDARWRDLGAADLAEGGPRRPQSLRRALRRPCWARRMRFPRATP